MAFHTTENKKIFKKILAKQINRELGAINFKRTLSNGFSQISDLWKRSLQGRKAFILHDQIDLSKKGTCYSSVDFGDLSK